MTEEKSKEKRTPPVHAVRRERKRKTEEKSLYMFKDILVSLVLGFVFGGTEFPLATVPLGCSLTAALPKYGIFALFGIWLRYAWTAFSGEQVLLPTLCATVIFVCRAALCLWIYGKKALVRWKRFPDAVFLRVMLCMAFSLFFSFFEMLREELTVQGALAMLFGAIASSAFAWLFAFFFDEEYAGTPIFEAGLGAIAFAVAISFVPISLGTLSLGVMVPFAITVSVGFRGSPTRSSLVGLLCGLAAGGYFAPVFALTGLVSGMLAEVSALLAGVSAVLVAVCGTLYFAGTEAVIETLPELALSGLIVTLLALLGFFRLFLHAREEESEDAVAGMLLTRRKEWERERRMQGFSRSMNSLSDVLRSFSERFRRPESQKLTERCLAIFRAHCEACPHACTCRGLADVSEERLCDKLASRLMASGKIDRDRLYELTKLRCPELDGIAEEISRLSAQMLEDAIREDKTQIFAADYEAMAQMFADAAAEGDMQLSVDRACSEALRKGLARVGLCAENALVCGERKKTVILTGDALLGQFDIGTVRAICEEITGLRFGDAAYMPEKGKHALILESLPRFTAKAVVKQRTKRGETLCGDSASALETEDGYYDVFLCDGMGSGEDAAMTSSLCRIFLEKMLACGNRKSTALSMLNHFLSSRTTECFATVDLVEIDLVSGVASFLKSGAVPSYVMRGADIYKIASGTFPIGILSEVSAEMTEFELCEGDLILLCSDGICSDAELADPCAVMLREAVKDAGTMDIGRLAERILNMADPDGKAADDMTVALVRIEKNRAENQPSDF